jgi:glycosyltransferase involved in cell wall biosynthesis
MSETGLSAFACRSESVKGGNRVARNARVAVIHPQLAFGGSEAAVLWTIEALKRDYDVTLISMGEVHLARLNAYYGTSLEPGDFSTRRVPLLAGLRNTARFAGLKGRFLQRNVRAVAAEFDALISGYGAMDFGKPGIQIIADFSFVDEWRLELHPTFRRYGTWFYGDTWVRRIYLGVCDRIAPLNPEAWKRNITLANSAWTAGRLRNKLGIASEVVYPPVMEGTGQTADNKRASGFVCLGRVSPEKCVHSVIDILRRVRERGHNVQLHLLGGIDSSEYGKRVRRMADRFREWVFLEGWVQGSRKKELLATHSFGINACRSEAFGMAVAEMVCAGCIVFVPNGGGQVEIVREPKLIYESEGDAVEKIVNVLSSDAEQQKLRAHLQQVSGNFSVAHFMESVKKVVSEFLAQRSDKEFGGRSSIGC